LSNTYRVVIELVGRDKASMALRAVGQETDKAGQKAKQAAGSFKNLAGAFTAMLVAQKLGQALISVSRTALDFEMSLNRMKVLTQANTESLSRMKNAAVAAAEKSTFGPQESADALIKLTQATGNAEIAMASLDSTMGLAMASMGKMGPEKAARMGADLIKAFGAAGSSSEEMAEGLNKRFDQAFAITRALGIEIHTFEKIIGRVGQAAVASGQSFEEMFTVMSLAARIAPSTLRASNQVLRMMTDMSKKGSDAMDQLGISTTTASGHMRPMTQIFAELTAKYQENDVAVRKVLFENFSAGAVKPILTTMATLGEHGIRVGNRVLKGAEALDHLRSISRSSGGEVKKAMNVVMKSSVGASILAQEAWNNFKRVLGEALLPMIGKLSRWAKSFLDMVRRIMEIPLVKWFNENLTGPITAVVTAGIALRATLWGVKQILEVTYINTVKSAIDWVSKLTKSIKAMNAVSAMETGVSMAGAGGEFLSGRKMAARGRAAQMGKSLSKSQMLMQGLGGFKGHLIIGVMVLAAYALFKQTEQISARWKQFNALLVHGVKNMKSMRDFALDWLKGFDRIFNLGLHKGFGLALLQNAIGATNKHLSEIEAVANKMVEASKKLKDNFTISSGMLEKALDKLKDVTKAKTQVIDVRQMRSIMGRLSKGRFQDEGDEMMRRSMLSIGKSILGDLRRMRDVGLSPREHKALSEKIAHFGVGAEDISTFHRGVVGPKMLERLRKQLIDPALAAGSVVQAKRTQMATTMRGGISYTREGGFLPGHEPEHYKRKLHAAVLDPYASEQKDYRDAEGRLLTMAEIEAKKAGEAEDKNPVVRVLKGMDRNMNRQLPLLRDMADAMQGLLEAQED
jgi:TP901 family phage tail tape measure protein